MKKRSLSHRPMVASKSNSSYAKFNRYALTSALILLMVFLAQWSQKTEIIFPPLLTLAIGLWVIDKGVWRIRPLVMIILLSCGALLGCCLARFSSLPLFANLSIAFLCTFALLFFSRSILPPLLSTTLLPLLFHTVSWIYPLSVFIGAVCLWIGQKWLEKRKLKTPLLYPTQIENKKKYISRWICMWIIFSILAWVSDHFSWTYLILPPLVVTFIEFSTSRAGFRHRAFATWINLSAACAWGCLMEASLHYYLHCPQWLVCIPILAGVFTLFEGQKKYFAPAGGLALFPLLIPKEDLLQMPLQVSIGAFVFITLALLLSQHGSVGYKREKRSHKA